jgi:hypothetical protein
MIRQRCLWTWMKYSHNPSTWKDHIEDGVSSDHSIEIDRLRPHRLRHHHHLLVEGCTMGLS